MNRSGILLLIFLCTLAWMNNRCSPAINKQLTTSTNSKEKPASKADKGDAVAAYAETFVGSKYKYGGTSPKTGFDCSGLVYTVMDKFDVQMNRVSRDQATQGKVIKRSEAQAGDLVFFSRTSNGRIFHVAIIAEVNSNGIYIVHSSSSRGVVKDNLSTSSYWKPKIRSFRRVL